MNAHSAKTVSWLLKGLARGMRFLMHIKWRLKKNDTLVRLEIAFATIAWCNKSR